MLTWNDKMRQKQLDSSLSIGQLDLKLLTNFQKERPRRTIPFMENKCNFLCCILKTK